MFDTYTSKSQDFDIKFHNMHAKASGTSSKPFPLIYVVFSTIEFITCFNEFQILKTNHTIC
jgi:hypothetical protein